MRAAVIYSSFAPFHTARVERTAALGKALGHDLVAISIGGWQRDYRWPASRLEDGAPTQVTLFPGRDAHAVPFPLLARRLTSVLAAVRCDVLTVPGGLRERLSGVKLIGKIFRTWS